MRVLVAEFRVEGEPVSKSRARFTKRGSKFHTYTPEKTMEAERKVAAAFLEAAGDHLPDGSHAYEVDAAFFSGTRQRRDVDNMVKLICDGLNGIAWADDNQVTRITGRKDLVDRDDACTYVRIYRLGPVDARKAKCENCGTEFDWYPSQDKRRFCTLECYHAGLKAARTKQCAQCGKPFEAAHGAKTCSKECGYELRRIEVNCDGCGVGFSMQRCHHKATNYCTPECRAQASMARLLKRTAGVCSTCGGPTSKKSYRQCRTCRLADSRVVGAPIIAEADRNDPHLRLEITRKDKE